MSADWTFPGEPEAEPRPNGHAGATGDAPGGSPFRPIDFPSLLGREAPPREYTVPGWMPAGCVTGLWGEGGVGKSMLAQQIATCVATGIAAFGFEVGGTGGPSSASSPRTTTTSCGAGRRASTPPSAST